MDAGRRASTEARSLRYAWRAGMIGLDPPKRTLEIFRAIDRLGQLGSAIAIAAIRHGERVGLIDELGSLTFADLHARSDALACGLRARGVGEGECVGILCRNHRGFLDITFAATKVGARVLYLNTDFAGPQLQDVAAREGVTLLVHDQEYEELVAPIDSAARLLGWTDDISQADSLEALVRSFAGSVPPPPAARASLVLLTSGTTGTPKGAPRDQGRSLAPLGALLSKVPYRADESTYVAAPMFHGLGFTQMVLSVTLGCTTIVQRRFAPERALEAVAEHRPTALVVVPVMLARIVSVLEDSPGKYDTSSLRIVFCSGAQLEAELVRRARRTIGEKLYNFYGSTEVAYATFATPEDLRSAPGCAGKVPFGAVVRLYDFDGRPVSGVDRPGRIFVGNGFQFEGYTGGGAKESIDGLMSTGDVGHFDAAGRLWIDGRDDDMIVSGGENLFPGEVEELLITHPAIEEAAVTGVDDAEFGKRLAAFVVLRPGSSLSEDEVREFVKDNLARYKVPRDVAFLDELPRNPTGKVLKGGSCAQVPERAVVGRRRTQAERRATTRGALLDAALACLIEDGYAGLTTRKVAERAGVSQGTQMHYFPTRARFVAEAVRHVAFKLDAELRERDAVHARTDRRRLEELLDHVWEIHTGPMFQAAMELWVAARTDAEIRAEMDAVQRDISRLIREGAAELFPELMARPRAGELLEVSLAMMRGLALLRFTETRADVERRWRRARLYLLELYGQL